MRTSAVIGGAVAVGVAVVALLMFGSRPSCDAPATVATVKEMAHDKVRDYQGAQFFLRNTLSADRTRIVMTNNEVVFTLSAFRDRGAFGSNGSSCAAQVSVHTEGQGSKADFATEYTIEPTSDGKSMVSARFQPN